MNITEEHRLYQRAMERKRYVPCTYMYDVPISDSDWNDRMDCKKRRQHHHLGELSDNCKEIYKVLEISRIIEVCACARKGKVRAQKAAASSSRHKYRRRAEDR